MLTKPPACIGCPRYRTGQGYVPPHRPLAPRLLVIGEQPGRNEVTEGAPFVGASGRELTKGIGDRDAAHITNVRRCRGVREESPAEKAASIAHCTRAYLEPEFRSLDSSAITTVLAVGADAMEVATGVRNAVARHGSVYRREEADAIRLASGMQLTACGIVALPPAVRVVVTSLHPAFAMRGNPQFKREIRRVFMRAAEWATGRVSDSAKRLLAREVDFQLIPTPAQWQHALAACRGAVVDVETPREIPTQITMVGVKPIFANGVGGPALVAPFTVEYFAPLRDLLADPKRPKVGHNFAYDAHAFNANGMFVKGVFDTIKAAATLWPPTSRAKGADGAGDVKWNALHMCVQRVLNGVAYWKEAGLPKQAAWYRAAFPQVEAGLGEFLYCALDVEYTYELWQVQKVLLEQSGMRRLYAEIESPAVEELYALRERGMLLDVELRDTLRRETGARVAELDRLVSEEASALHTKRLARLREGISTLEAKRDALLREASEVCWSEEAHE